MHLMALRKRTVICCVSRQKYSSGIEGEVLFKNVRHARKVLLLENLCIQNIVLREFMFMVDYNEYDYLYLPKP